MQAVNLVFTVYDRVAEEASPPFIARNKAAAIRMYLNSIKGLAPSDYWLYRIGAFNLDTMELTAVYKPERVMISEGEEE